MQGMIVGDYHSDKELISAFRTDMAQYVQEGKVKVREHLTEGIENAGKAFIEVGRRQFVVVLVGSTAAIAPLVPPLYCPEASGYHNLSDARDHP
jgi:hypothetical protein